jgi:hypothetical protein
VDQPWTTLSHRRPGAAVHGEPDPVASPAAGPLLPLAVLARGGAERFISPGGERFEAGESEAQRRFGDLHARLDAIEAALREQRSGR